MPSKDLNNYKYINSLAVTVVKASNGIVRSIAVTSTALAGKIGIYDHASAPTSTPIMSVSNSGTAATYLAMPYDIPINAVFGQGLTILTSGKAQNITVIYE